jgi:hypothetical protein
MTNDAYIDNPALRPTVLVHELMKTVYRAEARGVSTERPDATEKRVARETPRAA